MERAAEELIRAALHDLANTLAGIQGILDLGDPERPLSPRDRDRLTAVLAEGRTVLSRSRGLVLDTLPEPGLEPGADWARALAEDLAPLHTLFRTPVTLEAPAEDLPGPRLRGLVHALARLLLPYAAPGGLDIAAAVQGGTWTLRFHPVAALPVALDPAGSGPLDIAGRWARHLVAGLGAEAVLMEGEVLVVRGPC